MTKDILHLKNWMMYTILPHNLEQPTRRKTNLTHHRLHQENLSKNENSPDILAKRHCNRQKKR